MSGYLNKAHRQRATLLGVGSLWEDAKRLGNGKGDGLQPEALGDTDATDAPLGLTASYPLITVWWKA